MIRAVIAVVLAALVSLLPSSAAAQGSDRVMVFAAASLTDALQEIGTAYGRERGKRVVFSFAASMTLARQIELSAGADIFLAADTKSMDYLEQRNRIAKPSRQDLLGNRLVLIAPANSNVISRDRAADEACRGAARRTIGDGEYRQRAGGAIRQGCADGARRVE